MKKGLISEADESTLFLDEIGETSLEIQTMLLRVLDAGEFMPIGRTVPQKVNIRIVSATNRTLEDMVKQNTFRENLYFRLKGVVIQTRPLHEHRDDIPALVDHFLASPHSSDLPGSISAEALDLLMSYNWPGNIRELKYTIEVLGVASLGKPEIDAESVQSMLNINRETHTPRQTYAEAKDEALREFETRYFTQLLRQYRGNLNQAALAAGMYRANLIGKLKRPGISADDFRRKKSAAAQ